MDYTGTIKDMYRGMDGKFTISLYIEEEPGDIEALTDKRLKIRITEYKLKRSLSANAYFHALADKLRMRMHPPMSMAQMKNHLIADYGQVMYLEDGVPLIYKTNAPPEYVYNLENRTCYWSRPQKKTEKKFTSIGCTEEVTPTTPQKCQNSLTGLLRNAKRRALRL